MGAEMLEGGVGRVARDRWSLRIETWSAESAPSASHGKASAG
jgi:hypothetical protein